MRNLLLLGVVVGLLGVESHAQEATRLHTLFRSWHEWQLTEFPEMAMGRGDYTHADRVTDMGLEAIERRHKHTIRFFEGLHAIDASRLDDEDRLNYELFELLLSNRIEGHRFPTRFEPIGGRFGPQVQIPQMAQRVRFQYAADYENYLTRLEQVPAIVEDTIERLKQGLAVGWTPPRISLAGVPGQFESILDGGLDGLAEPFDRFPAHLADSRKRQFRTRYETNSLPKVREAVRRLGDFFETRYLPRCRREIGASDLSDGAAYYAYQLRVMTTTPMTAQEIHDLGLSEVARIRAEMLEVIRRSDFLEEHPDARNVSENRLFARFVDHLRTDPRFYHDSPEALLAGYRDICKRVDPWLPKLFGTLPRLSYGVREIPGFMAPSQTTAYYSRGDIRNGEPGWFYANTYALNQRPTYEMIPLALHEAVPGHHLQIAIAQELEGMPEFRKNAFLTAYGEGWALYAERLGFEMGLYTDPYDDFGRLLYEMWRGCRLVVDTGIHAFGWSRNRAIGFMAENTALSELNIANEVDRYIGWPGQACGYKIGELKIRELRRFAETSLRDRFDIRVFHDKILGAGALPLTILEDRVRRWINGKRFEAYD